MTEQEILERVREILSDNWCRTGECVYSGYDEYNHVDCAQCRINALREVVA